MANGKLPESNFVSLNRPHAEVKNQSISQWKLIDKLESEFKGKKVYDTSNLFEHEVWFDDRPSYENAKVIWKTHLSDFGPAMSTLVKVVFFEIRQVDHAEVSTIKGKLLRLKKSIFEIIKQKGLLAGQHGEYCLGLNHITDDDLLLMIDSLLLSATSRAAFVQECNEIARFIRHVNHFAKSVPVFEIKAQLPWVKSGNKGAKTWVDKRARDLDITFRTEQGFIPLCSETAAALIKESLTIIDDYGHHISMVNPYLKDFLYGELPTIGVAKGLLKKYSPIFRSIIPPPDISKLRDRSKIIAVFGWLRNIVSLARGACLNVLLFSTGLRNSDICNLKIQSCTNSGRIDMLYYIRTSIKKTKNHVAIPVPEQTHKTIEFLKKIKFTNSDFAFDAYKYSNHTYKPHLKNEDGRVSPSTVNTMLKDFAEHFKIPFTYPGTEEPFTAHNYRTTVAGWLDAHSNLSLLLIKRLFGHTNDVMPTTYLRNNPTFIQERKEQKEKSARETSHQMSLAASEGRVAGLKGEQLINGFNEHKSRLETSPDKSHSLTDTELILSFEQIIEHRILNESVCGFLTPFGVRCMRNPTDSTPPPCAQRSQKNKTREIGEEILRHMNVIDPQNCIGGSCEQAVLGPWSESILKTLLWNADYLKNKHGEAFKEEHFREQAISFIRQYGPPLKKIFHIEVLPDGTVNRE